MIIKIEENIKSFSSWTNMVKANAEKIKGFGATIMVYLKKTLQNLL